MKTMKMMKTMKTMVVLVLSCVLCVSADESHEDINISGCSDFDGEYMYGLDGEELWYADYKNKKGVEPQPDFVGHITYLGGYEQALSEIQICKQNLQTLRGAYIGIPEDKDAPSNMIIFPRDVVELGQDNTLLCHVTGFFPAPVNVTWTKNGQKVTEGTSINIPYPNKDGTFNQISRLKFVPQLGDIYSCSVEHLALKEPETRTWDVEKSQPGVGPDIICGLGLTVGLLGVAAGTFFLIKGNECS